MRIKSLSWNTGTSNEFGRQNRTSFELTSAGESKLILDEIQYQLDFLKTDSFVNNRRKAVITLLNIFATSTKNIASILTTAGLKDIFLHLGCLLTTINDPEIKEGIIALIFMLIQNKDGGLNTAVKLPSVVVKALVQIHNSAAANNNHSDLNIDGGNRSRTVHPGGKTDENSDLAFHSRRKKFATNSSNSSGNNPLFHSRTWPDCGDIVEDTECVETKEAADGKNIGTETPVKNDMSIGAVAMIHRKRKFGSANNLSSETLQALSQQQQEKKTGSNATTPSTTPLKRSKTVSGEMRVVPCEEVPLHFQREPATSSSVAEMHRDHSSQDITLLRDQSLPLSETAFTSPSPKKRNAGNHNGAAPTSSTATTPYTVHKTNTLATPLNSVLHCANIQSAVRELWPTLFSQFVPNNCAFCTQSDTETAEEVRIRQAELDTEMLSLVVVNRYLLDTVSRLTTSNTSGYSSSGSGAGRGEDGSTAEQQQNPGDADGESSELSQALISCQNMLREHDQHSGVSYLRRLCKQLAVDTDVISAAVVAQGSGDEMGGQTFQTPDEKKLLQISQFRVFLALGILEAACYKNPANQVYISTIKVRSNSTNNGGICDAAGAFGRSGTADSQTSLCGDNSTDLPLPYSQQSQQSQQQNHTSHRPSSSVSVSVLLLQLLHTLSPAVMRGILQLVSGSTATGAAADGGTADDILGGDVPVTRHKNSELFSRMFPELVTGSVKCNINNNDVKDYKYSTYNTASSQETLNTANTTGSAGSSSGSSSGSSQSAVRHSLVGVTVHTLFTSCLETLISVTNNNHAACTALVKHQLTVSGEVAGGAEDAILSSTLSTASSQRSQRCDSQNSTVAMAEQNCGSNGGAVKRVNSYGRRHKSATQSLDDETNNINNTARNSEDSNTNSSTAVHFLTALLAYCVAWRHVLVRCATAATAATANASVDGQKESCAAPSAEASGVKFVSAEGALSTSETFTERYIFDTSLYVMSLLTNLAEYSHSSNQQTTTPLQNRNGNSNTNSNSNTLPMNVCVLGSLSAFPHIQSYIPTASQFVPVSVAKEVSSDGETAQQMELVQYLVSDAYRYSHSHNSPASKPDNDTAAVPPSNPGSDLLQLLVALVLSETRGFLSDIVATDGAINQDNAIVSSAAVSVPQLETSLQGGTTAAEPEAPEPGKPQRTQQQTQQQSGTDAVPIAELILSSHAILLLHTMTVVTISSSDSSNRNKGDRNNSDVVAESTALVAPKRTKSSGSVAVSSEGDSSSGVDVEVLLLDVRERLPRRSNWLLIRVLKAFMALQMQTGIMLLESVAPVLRAIQSMTQQDTNSSSLLCGEVDSAAAGAGVDTQLDDDWENQLYCDDDDDDRMLVSSAAAKVHTTSTQQAMGDWVWNGRDFVWEATATTITVHNSLQSRNQSVNNINNDHSIVHNSGDPIVTSSITEEVSWLQSVIVGDLNTATAAHNNNTTSITTMTTLISSSGSGSRRGGGRWPEETSVETSVGVDNGDETEKELRGTAVMEVGDDLPTADDALADSVMKPVEAKRSVSAESRREGKKSVPAAREAEPKTAATTTTATTTASKTAKVTITTTADKHKLPQSVLIPQPVMGSFSQTSYSSSHSQHSKTATESTQSGVRRSSSVPVPRRPSTASEQNLSFVDPSVLKLTKSVISNTVVSSKVSNGKVINSNVAVDSKSDERKYVGGKRSARLITVDDQPLSHIPATAETVNNAPKTQKTLKATQQHSSSQPHKVASTCAETRSTNCNDGGDGSGDSGSDVAASVASSQTSWTAFHPNNNINNNAHNISNNYSRNGGDSKGDKNIKRSSNSSSVSYTQNSSSSNIGSSSSRNSQHPGCSSQDTSDSVFADLFPRTYKREVPTAPLTMSQSDVDILLNDQTIRSYGKSYGKHSSSSASNVDLAVAVGTESSERANLLPEKASSTVHKVTPTEDDERIGTTTKAAEVSAQDTANTGSSGWGKRRKFVGGAAAGAEK